MNKDVLGKLGEDAAARYLTKLGYIILARRWRERRFEIDLIAKDGDEIVFVEVKTRNGVAYGYPEESITEQKQRHLRNSALYFLESKKLYNRRYRIDVVAVLFLSNTTDVKFHLIRSAVGGVD